MDLDNPILVAVDFSPCSAAAFRRAKRIAAWLNAPLTALHVVTPVPPLLLSPAGPMGLVIPLPTDEYLISHARRRWSDFARQCGGADGAQLVIAVGSPRDRILETVRREKPGMLIVGATGGLDARHGIGPTAAACAQWAATQVLVVRERQAGPFRSIVACIDFSDTSRLALEHAISIATEDDATLHILHAYGDPWSGLGPTDDIRRNMPDFPDRYRDAIEWRVREFCEPLTHELNAVKPAFHAVEAANHAAGIMAFIAAHGCDLAVLGTRGKFNMRDFFWGSTAECVVREAACSVLAVRPPTFVEGALYQPSVGTAAAMHQTT